MTAPASVAARTAFVEGIHVAAVAAGLLCVTGGALVLRYVPRQLGDEASMHSGVEALEDMAELGIGGVPPAFAADPTTRAAAQEKAAVMTFGSKYSRQRATRPSRNSKNPT